MLFPLRDVHFLMGQANGVGFLYFYLTIFSEDAKILFSCIVKKRMGLEKWLAYYIIVFYCIDQNVVRVSATNGCVRIQPKEQYPVPVT